MLSILTRALLMASGARGIVVESYSSSSGDGSSPLTLSKPSGTVESNLLLAMMGMPSSATWAPPGDWSQILDSSDAVDMAVSHKLAGASEGSSYDFTGGGGALRGGAMLRISGGIYDTIGSTVTLSGNGDLVVPGVTAVGGMIIVAAFATNSGRSFSTPIGMTQAMPPQSASSPSFAIFKQNVGAGPTGTRTITRSGGTGNSAAVMIALKKA